MHGCNRPYDYYTPGTKFPHVHLGCLVGHRRYLLHAWDPGVLTQIAVDQTADKLTLYL